MFCPIHNNPISQSSDTEIYFHCGCTQRRTKQTNTPARVENQHAAQASVTTCQYCSQRFGTSLQKSIHEYTFCLDNRLSIAAKQAAKLQNPLTQINCMFCNMLFASFDLKDKHEKIFCLRNPNSGANRNQHTDGSAKQN